jgi:putative component of membrane protein insertase Oxa1/YidC/SpoIIIJ protein YidD
MKMLLLAIIRLYWRFWPRSWRRKCLYQETCSRYVHRVTRTQGSAAGVRALADRFGKCRSGYAVFAEDGEWRVRLADGSCIDASEAAPHVLKPYQKGARRLEKTLDSVGESPANVRIAKDSSRRPQR